MEKEAKKRVIRKYTFIAFLLITTAVVILLMIKYDVEGEKNMPFKLSKIVVQSIIDTKNREGSENIWDLELTQNNDIYIHIEKNEGIQSETKIKNIKIKRIAQTVKPQKGQISVLLPTSNNANKVFLNSTENYLNKTIEFNSNTSDNLERQEICQDGGMIAFRISNQNIGEYVSNEGDEIKYDKSLLEKAGIEETEIKFQTEIDLVIETTEDENYKGTITLDLPVDTFENRGAVTTEITDTSKIIFKRTE